MRAARRRPSGPGTWLGASSAQSDRGVKQVAWPLVSALLALRLRTALARWRRRRVAGGGGQAGGLRGATRAHALAALCGLAGAAALVPDPYADGDDHPDCDEREQEQRPATGVVL